MNSGKTSDPEKPPSSKKRGGRPKTRNLEPTFYETPRDRSADALKRLGVDQCKIALLPPINQILKDTIGSGIAGAIEAMRFSDGADSQTFLAKYDSIPERDRESLTIEVIALACDIDPRALLGEIVLAVREFSVTRFKLKAMDQHTSILEKRIEFAKLPGGYRDRDAIDTILGALPRNKSTFIDKLYVAGKDEAEETTEQPEAHAAVQQVEEMIEDEAFVFPDSEVMQEKIQPIRQRMLEPKR